MYHNLTRVDWYVWFGIIKVITWNTSIYRLLYKVNSLCCIRLKICTIKTLLSLIKQSKHKQAQGMHLIKQEATHQKPHCLSQVRKLSRAHGFSFLWASSSSTSFHLHSPLRHRDLACFDEFIRVVDILCPQRSKMRKPNIEPWLRSSIEMDDSSFICFCDTSIVLVSKS